MLYSGIDAHKGSLVIPALHGEGVFCGIPKPRINT
jgi:hypothetical protein